MKEQDKATTRDPSKIVINNMSDREFKVMITRILTGLEERAEEMSNTLNIEIRSNLAEIKASTSKIRNMFDGINSRLEEAEQ